MSKSNRSGYFKEYFSKPENKKKHREASRRWRKNNPKKVISAREKFNLKNPTKALEYNNKYREKNLEKILEWYERSKPKRRLAMRDRFRNQRQHCIEQYGGKCNCCGESQPEFLAFDHIFGGGNQHRKKIGNITDWLIRHDYPDTIQLLCHNCNMAKGFYGKCPHGSHSPFESD